jgi:hypothetical protein
MPGKYLRGALIAFRSGFLTPVPNVIVFQYNPETISHTWSPSGPPNDQGDHLRRTNPLAISGNPGEEFSFTLAMDSSDTISDGSAAASALAAASGVNPRLAALELLLFPSTTSLGQLLTASLSTALGSAAGAGAGAAAGAVAGAAGSLLGAVLGVQRQVPDAVVPAVLFVWGPGRVLPVRLTNLHVTESLYDSVLLVPTHVEAEVGLHVLTGEEIGAMPDGLVRGILNTAYNYMATQRQSLALDNLVNSTDSIVGMFPF